MKKHMNYDERVILQEGLTQRKNMAEIARQLGRSKSTIGREIRARSIILPARGNVCLNRKACHLPGGVQNEELRISVQMHDQMHDLQKRMPGLR